MMARFNKKLITLSSLLLAGSVNAGGPGFDNVNIDADGDLVINLDADTTSLAEGDGFLQQEVRLGGGGTYIQTVAIDPNTAQTVTNVPTLAFSDITFIPMSGSAVGCPAGATSCTPLVEGDGFLQQEVRVGTHTYIQTVVIDPIAVTPTSVDISTLAFDTTFIQDTGSVNGINSLPLLSPPPATNNVMLSWTAQQAGLGGLGTSNFGFQSVDTHEEAGTLDGSKRVNPFVSSASLTVAATGAITTIDPSILSIPPEVAALGIEGLSPALQPESFGAFRHGRQLLTWQAPLLENTAPQRWTAELNVLRAASFGPATTIHASEGSQVTLPVYLTAHVPAYPVTIPYTVSGSATPHVDHDAIDGEVIIHAGRMGTIIFNIDNDELNNESLEDVIFTLQQPTSDNVALGKHITTRVLLSDTHLPPQLDIVVIQDYKYTRFIDNYTASTDSLNTTAAIIIRANNPAHKYLIDWSETDNTILAATTGTWSKTLRFNPASIPAGPYRIKAKITDLLAPDNTTYAIDTLINISDITPPDPSTTNTAIQYSHTFDNGVSLHWPTLPVSGPFDTIYPLQYLDFPLATIEESQPLHLDHLNNEGNFVIWDLLTEKAPFQALTTRASLPARTLPDTQLTKEIPNTADGLNLRSGDIITASGKSGNSITPDDIKAHGGPDGGPALYPVDDELIPHQIVDFEISGLTTPGQSVSIVIPQENPIPENPAYRKYMPHAGWVTFTENDSNSLASASKVNGICPGPEDSAYVSGLTEGDDCIRLTIEDGGPNDADQQANSIIKDPGGVSTAVATATSTTTNNTNSTESESSGGGGSGLSLLWLLLTLGALRGWHRPGHEQLRNR